VVQEKKQAFVHSACFARLWLVQGCLILWCEYDVRLLAGQAKTPPSFHLYLAPDKQNEEHPARSKTEQLL
jgi:hypothetical protein